MTWGLKGPWLEKSVGPGGPPRWTFVQPPGSLIRTTRSIPSKHGGIPTERKVTFVYEKDTKNKYRFTEDADEPVMGTLYVTKDLFDQRPRRLEVTLRVVE